MVDSILIELIIATYWFWITLGCVLLALELLTPTSGYLLWTGISAFIAAFISWLNPEISWHWLFIAFAIISLIVTMIWYKVSKQRYESRQNSLNQRQVSLIGSKTTVMEIISPEHVRVKVADGSYLARSNEQLSIGDKVKVTGHDGIVLLIEKTQ